MNPARVVTMDAFEERARRCADRKDDPKLPHSLDLERAILNAALEWNVPLPPETAAVDFFRVAHRTVAAAILDLQREGQSVQYPVVHEVLRQRGVLDLVGGAVYLNTLARDGVKPSTAGVESNVLQLKALAHRRRAAELLLRYAQNPADVDVDRLFADLQAVRGLEFVAGQAPLETLRDRLARPRVPLQFRIPGWQPCGSRALLAAQFKAGKTTLVGNVIRALVDGGPFLGRHQVTPIAGTVVDLDFEMGDSQHDDWLSDQRIENDDRVIVIPLRGRASTFDILNPAIRADWARRLRDVRAEYLIWDCVRPLMDALGLDEHREAGRLLVAFDELLADAGIPDALVVHHMGHGGERSRGDSRLRDWPDVEWRLVRKDAEDPASPRFLSAYGRDVDIAECQLEFDPETRHLSIAGGSRRDAKTEAALEAVVSVLRAAPDPLSGRQVKHELRDSDHARNVIDAALKLGETSGAIVGRPGLRNARRYVVGSVSVSASRSAPLASRTTVSECPAAFIRRDTEHSIEEQSVSRPAPAPPSGISPEAWARHHGEGAV